MTVVKFLFVLALAVPLMVFMGYYIANLQKEFLRNLKVQKLRTNKENHIDNSNRTLYEKKYSKAFRQDTYDRRYVREGNIASGAGTYDSARANFDNSAMKRRYEERVVTQRRDVSAENNGQKSIRRKEKNTGSSKTREKKKKKIHKNKRKA